MSQPPVRGREEEDARRLRACATPRGGRASRRQGQDSPPSAGRLQAVAYVRRLRRRSSDCRHYAPLLQVYADYAIPLRQLTALLIEAAVTVKRFLFKE